jgi:hypothetical protein
VVPSCLIKLGQQALADVMTSVASGEPLVRYRLLAPEFYEGLKRDPRLTEADMARSLVHRIICAGEIS